MKYKCRITIPRERGHFAKAHGEMHHWQYSAINGEPTPGNEALAYLKAYENDLLRLRDRMTMMSADLRAAGVEVIREKIELVIFDKSAPVCTCCGTRKNLHRDYGSSGPFRCDSPDCEVL